MARQQGLSVGEITLVAGLAQSVASVSEVRLFGSRWHGTHKPDSDVDLAVTLVEVDGESIADQFRDHGECWNAELSALLGLSAPCRLGRARRVESDTWLRRALCWVVV